jgi:glutamyl-tRNA reductase
MSVLAIGLNHSTAPLDLRGRFAIPLDGLRRTVLGLRDHLPAAHPEVAILSTCNRTELYVAVPAGVAPCAHAPRANAAGALVLPAVSWLARHGGLPAEQLQAHTYVKTGTDAAQHAFRVAAGLDSMVLGEPQILGQMKHAVREAEEAGALGTTLHQLFQRSFAVAKEVRTCTEIGEHSVSMAAAVVRLGLQLFGDLGALSVLFVGAGEMIDRVATHVAARAPKAMAVANRSPARSQALCARLGAESMSLTALGERLHEFDIVVSCTASSLPLIGLGAVQRALVRRRHRPMLMVDLAVPRDIEPEVAHLPDVYLYTVDDLARLVHTAGEKRHAAVAQAEQIIAAGVHGFNDWLDRRATVPLIQALQKQTEDWRQAEMVKARRALARGQDVDSVLDSLSNALTRKMLHGALCELHGSAGESHRQCAESVQRLFLRPDSLRLDPLRPDSTPHAH